MSTGHNNTNDSTNQRDGYLTEAELCTAASKGQLYKVKKYVEGKNTICNRALFRAVQAGRTAVVIELLRAGYDPNESNCLVIACQKGFTRIAQFLLEHGAKVDVENNRPLLEAVRHTNTGCLRLLLEHGADPHTENESALLEACKHHCWSIVSALIDAGANVDARDGKPLIEACSRGFSDIVDILINAGADVNIDGDAPLRYATRGNHIICMISLLNAGADRSVLDSFPNLDETTLAILENFTRGSRMRRLRKAISNSLQKHDFKWQDFCSVKGTKLSVGEKERIYKLLQEQARIFGVDPNQKKRCICAELAKKSEQEIKERIIFDEDRTDLSGTPINELPYWKIFMVENIPFNIFDLIKLIQKDITVNPYTRNPLPEDKIKEREIYLRRVLTINRFKDFNLLENVSSLPILTDQDILRDRLEKQVWDKLLYPPPSSIIMNADDDDIDDMLNKLLRICRARDSSTTDDGDDGYRFHFQSTLLRRNNSMYPMFTDNVYKTVKESEGFDKKREFVNLLCSMLNYVDSNRDTRILTVSIVMRHFHNTEHDNVEDGQGVDDLTFMTEDDTGEEVDNYFQEDWYNFSDDDEV